jgi:putative transposase
VVDRSFDFVKTDNAPDIKTLHAKIGQSPSRSTAYYRPQETSKAGLALMYGIDELHLEHPFAARRMLRDMLRREGYQVGCKHVPTLMKKIGTEVLYKKPTTSHRHPGHRVYGRLG